MSTPFDSDIAAMNLSDAEKNGLQVYRNYSKAFEEHRLKRFAEQAPPHPDAIDALRDVLQLVATEEVRTLTVIACAFTDDQLKFMFKTEIADDVPGGRNALLSGFGPLSRLSQRIQMAHAFGWMSKDVLIEADHLRKVRNDISHRWDISLLQAKLDNLIAQVQHPVEQYLGDGIRLPEGLHLSCSAEQKFRIRLVWLLGRVAYESRLWVAAIKAGLQPQRALYGTNQPLLLREVSALCLEVTRTRVLHA
ncbi:MAG: hypothetical protein NTZ11_04115 [Gammaproteobacteria bacterium]|nr:hypothetical protein [Gammaproteobacteria bacterium]